MPVARQGHVTDSEAFRCRGANSSHNYISQRCFTRTHRLKCKNAGVTSSSQNIHLKGASGGRDSHIRQKRHYIPYANMVAGALLNAIRQAEYGDLGAMHQISQDGHIGWSLEQLQVRLIQCSTPLWRLFSMHLLLTQLACRKSSSKP